MWQEDKWPLRKVFIKPSDKYKRFTGFITNGYYKKKKKGPFWCSEIIDIVNEWRYYVSDGVLDIACWYWGDEANTPDPPLFPYMNAAIDMPKDFCGAIDFGMTKDGKFVLIEVQHPFACGWYGTQEQVHHYLQWLINGWIYMQNKIS